MGRRIVLFDLDHTLLEVEADREVLREVIRSFTRDPKLLGLDPTGRSDAWVVEQLAGAPGHPSESLWPAYEARYAELLGARLARDGVRVLPGVKELLQVLAADAATVLGVATGNLRASAVAKLAHAGLDSWFRPLRGGFGEDGPERERVVRAALGSVGARAEDRVTLVGDTVGDVAAGLACGVRVVGVATGRASVEELWSAGAHEVAPDLGAGVEDVVVLLDSR